MSMTQEHKDALAQGRREAKAIKSYLAVTSQPKRRGRPVTAESIRKRMATIDERIQTEQDPLKRVELIQTRLDLQTALDQTEVAADMSSLEEGFVANARSYSERKGISYTAWREAGVPASVLKRAGIKQTRSS